MQTAKFQLFRSVSDKLFSQISATILFVEEYQMTRVADLYPASQAGRHHH